MADQRVDVDIDLQGAARVRNAQPGVAASDYVTKAQLDGVGGTGVVAPVTARIFRNTNQSIPTGAAWTDLVWSNSGYQVNGAFWTSGAAVSFPVAGYYTAVSEVTFDGAGLIGAITAEVRILVNGTVVIDEALQQVLVGFPCNFLAVPKRLFAAGDTIRVQVRHSNASAVNVLTSGDNSPDIILEKDNGAKGDAGPSGPLGRSIALNQNLPLY